MGGGTRCDPEEDGEDVRGDNGERLAGDSIRGGREGACGKGPLGRNARGRLGCEPIARRIMLSIIETVLELTCTAWPLTACTAARPLRVLSDVRKTSARGGSGSGGVDVAVLLEVLELHGWLGDGVE